MASTNSTATLAQPRASFTTRSEASFTDIGTATHTDTVAGVDTPEYTSRAASSVASDEEHDGPAAFLDATDADWEKVYFCARSQADLGFRLEHSPHDIGAGNEANQPEVIVGSWQLSKAALSLTSRTFRDLLAPTARRSVTPTPIPGCQFLSYRIVRSAWSHETLVLSTNEHSPSRSSEDLTQGLKLLFNILHLNTDGQTISALVSLSTGVMRELATYGYIFDCIPALIPSFRMWLHQQPKLSLNELGSPLLHTLRWEPPDIEDFLVISSVLGDAVAFKFFSKKYILAVTIDREVTYTFPQGTWIAEQLDNARRESSRLLDDAFSTLFNTLAQPDPDTIRRLDRDSPAVSAHFRCDRAMALGALCMGMRDEFGESFGPTGSQYLSNNIAHDRLGIPLPVLPLTSAIYKLYKVAFSVEKTWSVFQCSLPRRYCSGPTLVPPNPGKQLHDAVRHVERSVSGLNLQSRGRVTNHVNMLDPMGINNAGISALEVKLRPVLEYSPTWLSECEITYSSLLTYVVYMDPLRDTTVRSAYDGLRQETAVQRFSAVVLNYEHTRIHDLLLEVLAERNQE